MANKFTMGEYVDLLLFDKKPEKKKKPLKESTIDVKNILEADAAAAPPPAETAADLGAAPTTDQEAPAEPNATTPPAEEPKADVPDPSEERDVIKQTIEKARQTLKQHKIKGDMVAQIGLSLQGQDVGKYEIGSEEYATITNFNIIFNKFGLNFKQLPDSIKSFSLSAEETISQSFHHNVSIMVEMIDEETFGIQVFIDDEGIRFDDLEAAIKEFDKQYGINIIDTINKKVRV